MREKNGMKLHVQCYSGSKADERPIRFRLDDREHFVQEIIDQWYGPEHIFFKLRANDGNIYILRSSYINARRRMGAHFVPGDQTGLGPWQLQRANLSFEK